MILSVDGVDGCFVGPTDLALSMGLTRRDRVQIENPGYKDANAMLREIVPDLAAVITPTKFMKEAVISCAEAGVNRDHCYR